MLTKLKELSAQAKIAVGAGLGALLALGIGVAVWQPWNETREPPQEPDTVQQEPTAPQEQTEKGLSVKANGGDVPCTLYEGDGWSIYVPEGWEVTPGTGKDAAFVSDEGDAGMVFNFQAEKGGRFFVLSKLNDKDKVLQFCDGDSGAVLTVSGPESKWNRYEKLFTALAKTVTVGQETPFVGSYALPQEPDWQEAEGMTILFQDKDGVVLDDMVEKAVEEYMCSWPAEDRTIYTGQYRVNGIDWVASYTGLSKSYIDVFRARVQYRIAADAEETVKSREGVTVVDGWATLPDYVHLVFSGDATKPETVIAPNVENWVEFVDLIK